MEPWERPTPLQSRYIARRFAAWCGVALAGGAAMVALFWLIPPNRPVDFESEREHFYYGSIGSDVAGGLPLDVVRVLPSLFPEYLPPGSGARDYTAFGFIQEPGRPMPIGFSERRRVIDFTAPNCALCHTGSVRETPGAEPMIVAGMPANTIDLHSFFNFLFETARDERFTAENVVAAMQDAGIAGPLDGLVYRLVVPKLRAALIERGDRLSLFFDEEYPPFGPGRVNTFDTFKYDQFAPYYERHHQPIDPDEIYGVVAFPSVWNQGQREGLQLHWDGNNTSTRERNFSAAIGSGAEPATIDVPRLQRVGDWLDTLPPPPYPFSIDREAAGRGEAVYQAYCMRCHSFGQEGVGRVIPVAEIGTDRHRLDSYTEFLMEAQKDYTQDYPWAFSHFRKTDGYASPPLDGIWARGPYLHNGSVPTVLDLLTPAEERPTVFVTGSDVYDQVRMGFVHEPLDGDAATGYTRRDGTAHDGQGFVFDTRVRGNGNWGHTGPAFGTHLEEGQKRDLIEYLKWKDRAGRAP
jgi:hypothetical protein